MVTAEVADPEGGPVSSTPTVFDPTRVVDGIELSDDPILRYRPGAYSESVSRRTTRCHLALTPVKTLVIGTGGREHALARALARDPGVTEVHAAPGNPGIAAVATLHDVDPLDGARGRGAGRLARRRPGRRRPGGTAGRRASRTPSGRAGIAASGPSGAAARLEGSKAFAKEVMDAAGVPTARAFVCTTAEEAAAALDELGAPYVVKDDGLAAGKGVVVTDDRDEALAHAGARCERVVIEEYLDGPEVSLFAITDGTTVYPLQPAQDFKRIFDGDEGPNTGGMGAYTPLPWAPPGLVDEVLATVLQPTVDELARRGTPFSGLLYAGLALTSRGVRVVEFNARFGDPETQPLLALLESPLGELLMAAATGTLADVPAAGLRRRRRGRRGDGQPRLPGLVVLRRRDHRRRRGRGAAGRARHPRRHRAPRRRRSSPPAAGCSPWSAPAPTWRPPAPRRTPASR